MTETLHAERAAIVERIPDSAFPDCGRRDRELRGDFVRGVLDGALGDVEETGPTPEQRQQERRRAYLAGFCYGRSHSYQLLPAMVTTVGARHVQQMLDGRWRVVNDKTGELGYVRPGLNDSIYCELCAAAQCVHTEVVRKARDARKALQIQQAP